MKYISLIMDVKESKKYSIEDRNNIQEFMIACTEQLNVVFEDAQEFPVVFSAGDEVQGLFKDLTAAVLYLRMFEILIHPVRIRAGIGIGAWTVKVANGSSTQQDGPTYHQARSALIEAQKRQTQRYRINSEYGDELANNLINMSCVLKEQQGIQQNVALLIMELLFPIEKKGMMSYDHQIMKRLLHLKYRYKMQINHSNESDTSQNEDLLRIIEPILIDGTNYNTEEVISKKNMSYYIAEIMGCKRQNADKLIKRGNLLAIRNMDYTALQYIESR